MSADMLRQAAEKMLRGDGSGDEILAAMAEVAHWLNEVAYRSEHYPKQYRAAKFADRVARAYLGDDTPNKENNQ